MLSDFVEPKWQRPRGVRPVHVVAVLCALAAAGSVLGLFNEFGVLPTDTRGERQLVATVDLRLGTPALAAERGAAQARFDVAAGELKLQTVGPKPSRAEKARAERMTQRYGVAWVRRSEEVTPLASAYAEAYNRVMHAEIERRHGKAVADGLLGFEAAARPHGGGAAAAGGQAMP
ncbi:MAG: hypothetical protein QM788_12065 [Roseateles sp.]|uniref:hypothetical protein n=1 Tax=Roseateles sp. TaxID=1971397 RepID=UPI0039E9508B